MTLFIVLGTLFVAYLLLLSYGQPKPSFGGSLCPGCAQKFEISSQPPCGNGLRYCEECRRRALCGC